LEQCVSRGDFKIVQCRRLNGNVPRKVIVQFSEESHVELILKNRSKLRGSRVFVDPDLSVQERVQAFDRRQQWRARRGMATGAGSVSPQLQVVQGTGQNMQQHVQQNQFGQPFRGGFFPPQYWQGGGTRGGFCGM